MTKTRVVILCVFLGIPILVVSGFLLLFRLSDEQLLGKAVSKYQQNCEIEATCVLVYQDPVIKRIDKGYEFVWSSKSGQTYIVFVTYHGKAFWIAGSEN